MQDQPDNEGDITLDDFRPERALKKPQQQQQGLPAAQTQPNRGPPAQITPPVNAPEQLLRDRQQQQPQQQDPNQQ